MRLQGLRATAPLLQPSITLSKTRIKLATNHVKVQSRSLATAQLTCPSCSAPLPSASVANCPKCSKIVPPPPHGSVSHYDLFDLSPAFRVDRLSLKRQFIQWQQKVHPDTAGGSGDASMARWARDWSGWVNDAYRTLDSDLTRAEYLLALRGVEVKEEDKASDPELLMSIMEIREALEEAETEVAVASIRDQNKDTIGRTVAELDELFKMDPLDSEKAKEATIRLRYYQNIEDVCREWQPGKRIELQH